MKKSFLLLKSLSNKIGLSALLLTAGIFANAQTVTDIVVNSVDHDTLEAAVVAAGLADDLSDPNGTFTLFAPTDAAFKALPEGTIGTLLSDPEGELSKILLYHVLGAEVKAEAVTDGLTAVTLNGKSVSFTIVEGLPYINDVLISVTDVEATNGVVHIIDAVLLPPVVTVTDIVVNSMDHDTLEAAVIAAGLDDDLADLEGSFTLFAPTDAAFKALPEGTIGTLLSDPEGELSKILLYHVLGSEVKAEAVTDGLTAVTLNGKSVSFSIVNGMPYINDVLISVTDIMADNGVVHVIDAVLLPPVVTVTDIVVNSMDHDTLEAAVIAAGLDDDLADLEGSFTLFAPTDAAFKALPEGTIGTLLSDPEGELSKILLYHVLGSEVKAEAVTDGLTAVTLNGKSVSFSIVNGMPYINDVLISVTDIMADNGVVHVIDAVLLPPVVTVTDIVVNSMDHDTLEAAVIAAGLDDDLADLEKTYTLFAPTDAAFKALPEGTIGTLLSDPEGDLATILLYHVLGSKVMSSEVTNGLMAPTLQGESLEFSIVEGKVFVKGAEITVFDIQADNGVVHVIDAVLIPGIISSISNKENVGSLSVYPNPAVENTVYIENQSNGTFTIVSLEGIVMLEGDYSANGIQVDTLEKGVYTIQLNTGDKIFTSKFVK